MKRIKLSEEQFKQLVELNMDDLIGTEVIDKPIYGMNTLNTEQESIDVEPDVEGYVSLEETDEIDEGADLEGPSKYGYGNDAPFKDSPNFNVGESVTADPLGDVIKYAIRETLNEEWENPCDGVGLNPTQYEDCLGNCCATMGGECCNEKTTGIGKGMTSDSKSVMDSEGALKRTELIKKKMALRDKQVQRKKMNENSHHLVHSDQRDVTEEKVLVQRDDDCMCMKWEQVQADTWKCVQDKPVGCITGSGMTTKKDKKEMRESKYTRNRTNIERFLNEQVAQCDSPCSKQCGDLPIPQSWYDMVDTKGCNFVTNRMNNMQQRIDDMLTDPTNPQGEHCNCQFKRLQCKMNYLKDRKISLGC